MKRYRTEESWFLGRSSAAAVALSVGLLGMLGCSTTHFRESADREAYAIIQEKTQAVQGMGPDFTIEKDTDWSPLDGLPVMAEGDESLGGDERGEVGAAIISLERALEIAVKNNRSYQNHKEALYLQALSLTLDRHRYTPLFSAGMSGDYTRSTTDVTKASDFGLALTGAANVIDQVELMTGQPADILNAYADLVEQAGTVAGVAQTRTEIMNERSLSGDTRFGVDVLLKGGGRIALGLTSNFLRFLTGDPSTATSSVLTGSFTQPLLRGAGSKVAAERLTQAERNVLYELREFTRFRKEFTVNISSAYYGVLQDCDIVRNNYRSYRDFQRNVERERAFAVEGRRTQAELGRLLQAELNTENGWVNAVRRYKESLDRFKIQLGLSTDARVVLDDGELERLQERGLQHPDIAADDAVRVALEARLDFYNAREWVEDSKRGVAVAANALKPDLDLIVAGSVDSTGQDNFQELDFRRGRWSAGLDADLPLDRKAERNAYRAALIEHERVLRNYDLAEDNVKLEVRAAWRNLDQARRNYEVALRSVELSERRVEEQALLAELGLATAQDQVDAQNDLTQSKNDLTEALVSHTIARLAFWRDMGILYIKENGQWEEVTDDYDG